MKKVLFICTGNTCRSPIAEAFTNNMLRQNAALTGEIEAESAGLYALDNEKASPEAVQVVRTLGIDLTSHRSRQVNEKMLREADLVLTMTRKHRQHLHTDFPYLKSKVYTLAEYAGRPEEDIPDPYGRSLEVYRQALWQIRSLLEVIISQWENPA